MFAHFTQLCSMSTPSFHFQLPQSAMERDLSYSEPNPLPHSSSSTFPVPIKIEFPSTTILEMEEKEAGLESGGAIQGAREVPRPLDCLHETPIPPFLSKTYDIIDDCTMDAVISWGPAGNSFVVWDPHLFEKAVLPRNFKHGNFSTFVRQLNTYVVLDLLRSHRHGAKACYCKGFRKISADRWEFANECFLRGNKQLLKNINRRRSHGGAKTSSSLAIVRPGMESELQNLKRDKNALLQEVFKLQQDQMTTVDRMSSLNQKLLTAEERQKQMVSFLAKILRNPNMLAQFRMHREQRHRRKFLKHQMHGQSSSLIQPPDAVWNNAVVQSEQGNELMREPPYLEGASLPENVFPEAGLLEADLHGSSSGTKTGTKGKGIMEELQHSEYDKGQNIRPFPDIDFTGDPNLLELPDAFYDLDLDFDLELGQVDKIVDGQAPTE